MEKVENHCSSILSSTSLSTTVFYFIWYIPFTTLHTYLSSHVLYFLGNCPVSNLACNARSGNKNILVWMPPAQSVDISYDVINLSNNQSSSTTSFFYESINETPLEFEVKIQF